MKSRKWRRERGASLAEFPIGVGMVLFGALLAVFLLGNTALVLVYKLKLAVAAQTIALDSSLRVNYDASTGVPSTWGGWNGGWVSKLVENLQDNTTYFAGHILPLLGLPGVSMNGGLPIQLDTSSGVTLRTYTVPVSSNVPLLLSGCSFIPGSANLQENGVGFLTVDAQPGAFCTIKAQQSNILGDAGAAPAAFGGTFAVAVKAYQSSNSAGVHWYPGIVTPPQYVVNSANPCVTTRSIAPSTTSWISLSPVD